MRLHENLEYIGVDKNTGLFLLDFMAWFPYSNQDSLILHVTLSTEKYGKGITAIHLHDDCVFNHRCPNTGYICMTSKHGRKRCKNGYALQMPYDELNRLKYITIGYGFREDYMAHMCIPINIGLTESMPCTSMSVNLMIEDPNEPGLHIYTNEMNRPGAWRTIHYSISGNGQDSFVLLTPERDYEAVKETGCVAFQETVNLIPSSFENLVVL